nr:PREDICTED: protein phosphatase Slingshot homolog 3 [Latimeria chalumnae]|eukprot:XP_005999318.1 PREDICTED: protein phosphatase Slingshot homolog 3 [Latimeria chalumnae]
MVKGAALLLQEEEEGGKKEVPPLPGVVQPTGGSESQREHLQAVIGLLRPQDTVKLVVRLESSRPQRIRYLMVVSSTGLISVKAEEVVLLGVDFADQDSDVCTIGMVLPLWNDAQVFLDGDGGFSVTSAGQTRIFKPISVQTMWSLLQVLHKACEDAVHNNYFPGGSALMWAGYYGDHLSSEQGCINEWMAMSDLESVRPEWALEEEGTATMIKAKLREVLVHQDLETLTSRQIRLELEKMMGLNLSEYRELIDKELILIVAQMDTPSKIFEHLYLGSEWNASNLEELLCNGVGYILNVTREIDNFFPETFEYFNIRVYDDEVADLMQYWKDTYKFITKAKKNHSKVLVHCKMGVSRSASTVMAYAMKEYGWTLDAAYRHVKERRAVARPNPSFMKQLNIYHGILEASKQRHNCLWRRKSKGSLSDSSVSSVEQGLQRQESKDASLSGSLEEDESSGEGSSLEEESDEAFEEEPEGSPTEVAGDNTPACYFRPVQKSSSESGTPPAQLEYMEKVPSICIQEVEADALDLGVEVPLKDGTRPHGSAVSVEEAGDLQPSSLPVADPDTPKRKRFNLSSLMRSISEMGSFEQESSRSPSPSPRLADTKNNQSMENSRLTENGSTSGPETAAEKVENQNVGNDFEELKKSDKVMQLGPSKDEAAAASVSPGVRRKSRREERVLRHSEALDDQDIPKSPNRHGKKRAEKAKSKSKVLKKQKKVGADTVLPKQLSFQPEAGKVKKRAQMMEKGTVQPEDLKEVEDEGEDSEVRAILVEKSGASIVQAAGPAEKMAVIAPRLKHMESILQLKEAGLVSKKAKEFEHWESSPAKFQEVEQEETNNWKVDMEDEQNSKPEGELSEAVVNETTQAKESVSTESSKATVEEESPTKCFPPDSGRMASGHAPQDDPSCTGQVDSVSSGTAEESSTGCTDEGRVQQ